MTTSNERPGGAEDFRSRLENWSQLSETERVQLACQMEREIRRLHDLHLERTKLTERVINERDAALRAIASGQVVCQVAGATSDEVEEALAWADSNEVQRHSHGPTAAALLNLAAEVRRLRAAHQAPQAESLRPPKHDCEFYLNPPAGKCDMCEMFAAGYAVGAQAAEQGPVAWMWVEDPWGANEHHVVFDDPKDSKWTPLYARPQPSPPQAEEK